MSQEYVFDFFGTKEDFLNVLNKFSNYSTISHGTFFYFNDYIVKVIEFDDTPNSEYHKTGFYKECELKNEVGNINVDYYCLYN